MSSATPDHDLICDAARPIQVRGRKLGCRNGKFTTYMDHVAEPGGEEVPGYFVVEATGLERGVPFGAMTYSTGVVVVPVAHGKVGMHRMFRHAVGDWVWELPRGFVDVGEEPPVSALRELTEECGLTTSPDKLIALGDVYPETGILRLRTSLFAALDCQAGPGFEGEMGLGQFQWVDVDEALKMAASPQMTCAVSSLALLRAKQYVAGLPPRSPLGSGAPKPA